MLKLARLRSMEEESMAVQGKHGEERGRGKIGQEAGKVMANRGRGNRHGSFRGEKASSTEKGKEEC